jgi:hypothetical protein
VAVHRKNDEGFHELGKSSLGIEFRSVEMRPWSSDPQGRKCVPMAHIDQF